MQHDTIKHPPVPGKHTIANRLYSVILVTCTCADDSDKLNTFNPYISLWLTWHCIGLLLLALLFLQSLLGQVDLAFLAAYAAGMFTVGHYGDSTDLRIFLSVGMLGSGIFCVLFGMVGVTVAEVKLMMMCIRTSQQACINLL